MGSESGDSTPQVITKVEETSSIEQSSAASAVKAVDGEVVSSLEEASKIKEGDIITESSANLSESSGIKVADGEVLESRQESSFKESNNERNLNEQIDSSDIKETIENKAETQTDNSNKEE